MRVAPGERRDCLTKVEQSGTKGTAEDRVLRSASTVVSGCTAKKYHHRRQLLGIATSDTIRTDGVAIPPGSKRKFNIDRPAQRVSVGLPRYPWADFFEPEDRCWLRPKATRFFSRHSGLALRQDVSDQPDELIRWHKVCRSGILPSRVRPRSPIPGGCRHRNTPKGRSLRPRSARPAMNRSLARLVTGTLPLYRDRTLRIAVREDELVRSIPVRLDWDSFANPPVVD